MQEGRSILSKDAQGLLNDFHSGSIKSSQVINNTKIRVDFGNTIGTYINPQTGQAIPTTKGIIHFSQSGAHIIPCAP